MTNNIYRMGWIPDLPDRRDFMYAVPRGIKNNLPPKVDFRPDLPPVYNQGSLGSCTGNAIAGAHHFEQIKQGQKDFIPSRLMIYWNERYMEGTINSDCGAMIRDGIKSVAAQGVCPESMWEYNVGKFKDKPSEDCYSEAMNHQVISYMRVSQTLDQMRGCLAEGYPITFGFTVYEGLQSSYTSQTGILNMPTSSEECMGGHAVLCVGYDDASQRFLVRNSWGEGWGQKGYFTMPYAYMTDNNLADDFWTIRLIE